MDSLHDAVRADGTPICKTRRDEPWQMREFGIVTPDGRHAQRLRGGPLGCGRLAS